MKTKFQITIEKEANKINIIESSKFSTKAAANKFKNEMIKKYNFIKHAGHIVNYSNGTELFTNY